MSSLMEGSWPDAGCRLSDSLAVYAVAGAPTAGRPAEDGAICKKFKNEDLLELGCRLGFLRLEEGA